MLTHIDVETTFNEKMGAQTPFPLLDKIAENSIKQRTRYWIFPLHHDWSHSISSSSRMCLCSHQFAILFLDLFLLIAPYVQQFLPTQHIIARIDVCVCVCVIISSNRSHSMHATCFSIMEIENTHTHMIQKKREYNPRSQSSENTCL